MSNRTPGPIVIASLWHSGQWSALYSLASTGQVRSLSHARDIRSEARRELERIGTEDQSRQARRDRKQLRTLLRYVRREVTEIRADIAEARTDTPTEAR